ncbi:hypothetical protein [uncultured Methanobrevibacter sp.]|uniref:hypothetical protein n=1 Tax=uncultured Methanobrevibacter sp. TaxID=253161 RepID=UPI0025DF7BE2|nr:hypothetical protein [uncultured Methanobrevibacter sp.]
MLSTRPDMVGERIAKEFEQLQEDNPPVPYDEVKQERQFTLLQKYAHIPASTYCKSHSQNR